VTQGGRLGIRVPGGALVDMSGVNYTKNELKTKKIVFGGRFGVISGYPVSACNYFCLLLFTI
jgi:hypothetical protein